MAGDRPASVSRVHGAPAGGARHEAPPFTTDARSVATGAAQREASNVGNIGPGELLIMALLAIGVWYFTVAWQPGELVDRLERWWRDL